MMSGHIVLGYDVSLSHVSLYNMNISQYAS